MTALGRAQYSAKEFAVIIGVSYWTLIRGEVWRRYGGKKIRGRIVFPERARLNIAEGRL